MRNNLLFIIIFITTSLLTIHIYARQVNNKEIILTASHFLTNLNKANEYSLSQTLEIKSNNTILAYAIELVPEGYIIISADTDLPPVIAYSFESTFGEANENNPLYSLIKADLYNRYSYIKGKGVSVQIKNNLWWNELLNENIKKDTTFQQWPDVGNGWLKTNWTQNAPYYNFCPIDPVTSSRSIAGCPSVAMAQILNFHASTNNTHFDDYDDYYHNYAGRQYWIDNDYAAHDFPSFPDLNSYLDTLNNHYENSIPLTNNDKAALTFACGVAATQVYTSSGSGTFGVSQAFAAYQKFSCFTAELLDTTDTDLFERLSQNMKDALPAHLAIVDPSWSSGHNVVVDGYNTDNYYHLNFGWGGSYNGWYLLPDEIPYNLTVIEGVIVDIMKSTTNITSTENIKNNITVYPNPFVENTTISFNSEKESKSVLNILDISGNVVKQIPVITTKGKQNISLSLENCNSGFYFYQISRENSIYTGKLVKIEK
jgi:hypothetical protein